MIRDKNIFYLNDPVSSWICDEYGVIGNGDLPCYLIGRLYKLTIAWPLDCQQINEDNSWDFSSCQAWKDITFSILFRITR